MTRSSYRSVCVLIAGLSLSACEGDKQHRALDSLVRNGATQEQVVTQLGPGVTVYERGTPSWDDLQKFLAREPPSDLTPLRQAVQKYPRILYYTTEWRMTWLFLDERGVVREYYLTAQ
jgi:hypothetical protein